MTVKLLFITIVAFLKVTNSQYYSPPAPGSFQRYNYFPSAPTLPVSPSVYAPTLTPPTVPAYFPPPMVTQPPTTFAPLSFYAAPSISGSIPIPPGPLPNYAPSPIFLPQQTPAYPPPVLTSPNPYTIAPPISNYAPVPAIPPKYPTTVVSSQPRTVAPKCTPPTAFAYYLTTPLETPKAVARTEKVKEVIGDKLPPPTYSCPFCTGFANEPKNPKVSPPPPCSSVLPGILDQIPTIKIPDELKIKDLSKFAKSSSPLLADLFEHKLSGKLRFDEDLLDGFLTGLGLGKYND